MDDGTGGEEGVDYSSIGLGGVEGESGDADGGVDALDVESVFDRYGKAVKGPEGFAGAIEMSV